MQKGNTGKMASQIKALAYIRTSSAANVGQDKDSDTRQRTAIEAYAARNGIMIAGEYYDAAVSGADPIETRPGFADMLARIDGNGVRLVIVEDATRFARDMMASVLGLALLRQRGVTLVTASGQNLTDVTDPYAEAFGHMAAAFAHLEKRLIVAKLAGARARKREATGRCEGRKPIGQRDPAATQLARKLKSADPTMSLRQIAATLAEAGHMAKPRAGNAARPYAATVVAAMLVD